MHPTFAGGSSAVIGSLYDPLAFVLRQGAQESAEWDRATRSMMDGVHIIERIHARGAMIKVLDKPHLDLTTPIGRGFIVKSPYKPRVRLEQKSGAK
jgi:hypothetical protein